MSLPRWPHFAVIAAALTTMACSGSSTTPAGYCSAPFTPAVLVTPVDSVTGKGLGDSASGSAYSSTSFDSLHHGWAGSDSLLFGGNSEGTYAVAVDRPGYRQWLRGGIVVTPTGSCGNVVTAELVAKLQKAP